ncbi:unnamed protein product [Darwinula stevensoni]|uniref:G-protein coupled receptors family 2 profile 2 domain-containing protein n=1 Tax=Darwinula stevensoni TaxID=69355 RepID=A0A7R9A429_9CRUS|nr:unnamed protein product [Darwinula stevensoni]CAG0889154.1 unnamed protein product [Darwinula stevensoni]
MTFVHLVVSFLLILLPGDWVNGDFSRKDTEVKCCPRPKQFVLVDQDDGRITCQSASEGEPETPPFEDCKSKRLTLAPSDIMLRDPILFLTTSHCYDDIVVRKRGRVIGRYSNSIILCPPDADRIKAKQMEIPAQKCCPMNEGYDMMKEKCIPYPYNWTISILKTNTTSQFLDLSPFENQLGINDLSSMPCAKYFLSANLNGKPYQMNSPVVQETGGLYVPAMNSTFPNDQFCWEIGYLNESWINLARICHPTEKKMKDCEGKVCVQKCCPESDNFLGLSGFWPVCTPAISPGLWDPRKYFRSQQPPLKEDIHVITGPPMCPFRQTSFIQLFPGSIPNMAQNFSLTRTGSLTTMFFGAITYHFDVPQYCIDETMNEDGELAPIAYLCHSKMVEVASMGFLFVPLGAAILLLTFLFILVSSERKSLPGKTRLFCVGCLLVEAVSSCFRINAFGIRVSYSYCLVAELSVWFWNLSAFFWLNVMSYDLWKHIGVLQWVLPGVGSKKLVLYSLYAFGAPACLVAIAYILHFTIGSYNTAMIISGMEMEVCFVLGLPEAVWYSMISVLVADAIFLCLTCRYMIRHARDTFRLTRNQEHKQTFWLYLALFVVMGGTWLARMISSSTRTVEGLYFSLFLPCLQGILIFLLFMCKATGKAKRKVGGWLAMFPPVEVQIDSQLRLAVLLLHIMTTLKEEMTFRVQIRC